MIKRIKRHFNTRKLENLKIKHSKLLKEADSMNKHSHNSDSERVFKKIHKVEKEIEHLESIL
jgi:hypothetical protein